MGSKKEIVPAIAACLALALVAAFSLILTARQKDGQYEQLVSLEYSVSGGFGPEEEMTETQFLIRFTDRTFRYERTKAMDDSVLNSWEGNLEQSRLDDLRSVLRANDFLSLPEEYGSDMSPDSPGVVITLETSEAKHTTSGFDPGDKRFQAVQDTIEAIREEAIRSTAAK